LLGRRPSQSGPVIGPADGVIGRTCRQLFAFKVY
jgi:hypothetical protein